MSKKPLAIDASTVLATKDKALAAVSGSLQRGQTTTKALVDLNFKVPAGFRQRFKQLALDAQLKAVRGHRGIEAHLLPELWDPLTYDNLMAGTVAHFEEQERRPLVHISFLNPAWEPSDVRHHLYSCGYERDEDALEVETQWVRNKTSPFSSLLMPR